MNDKHPLYTTTDIRRIEKAAMATLPPRTLMQRAGLAAAHCALGLLAQESERNVLLLAGPGNNGGDAFETSMHLAEAGCHVVVMFAGDAAALPPDAMQAFHQAQANRAITMTRPDAGLIGGHSWSLIVDGLFGIGLSKPIQGLMCTLVDAVNRVPGPVLALDVPSGLCADRGVIVGDADGVAIRATHTITFIGDKPGLHTGDGRDHAGTVYVDTLAIEPAHDVQTKLALNGIAQFETALKPRAQNSHKGSFGDLIVVGGAIGMVGAAILTGRSAAKCGTGRVFIVSPDDALAYDPLQPELMCRPIQPMAFEATAMAVGPGLGQSRTAHDALNRAIGASSTLVLDADALNILAVEPGLQQKLRSRQAATIITPHPLEAARLLACSAHEVQGDRLAAARQLADRLQVTAILKGSGTVVALADGRTLVNDTGNAALATAGAGDVLTGVCGALLAQGWLPDAAASGAVWLHGKAADELVHEGMGPIGLAASELIPQIRLVLNRLVREHG